ncbi:hypothetical protein Q2K19_02345 [Micromonospora soli]|uniref:DUF7144 family membrane protein n=1 Tax=Micromonospora sp. NBRC 110009 TaxID=3061627 RepID=UPI002670DD31|nr:hypothetical protein [Micromonospora sp. NBRC 110009]WKT99371.1 hypothetical protein Q2K19_02345 [Micromonospora sp. NBRC 110009]
MRAPQPAEAAPDGPGRPLLAGGLLVASGLIDVLSASATLAATPFLVLTPGGVYPVDITGWARLHLAIGVAVALTGLLAVTGRRGTAGLAVGCAALAIVVDILLLPYAPFRALLVAAVNGAAIRLLIRHRRAVRPGR